MSTLLIGVIVVLAGLLAISFIGGDDDDDDDYPYSL